MAIYKWHASTYGETERAQIAPGLFMQVYLASVATRNGPPVPYSIKVFEYEHGKTYANKDDAKQACVILARQILAIGSDSVKKEIE